MNEFERARKRAERRKAKEKVVPIRQDPAPRYEVHISVIDGLNVHEFSYSVPNLPGTRMKNKRTLEAYEQSFQDLIHKEFGKWQLIAR